tara:strand:- start:5727 stop:6542 length:816 start_codon:yes stop_codon:yes gene_type:complete
MQGRLSPPINKNIQKFPHNHWKDEFSLARDIGFDLIEWVVDDEENPIFDDRQINEILELSKKYNIQINSLCADIFMKKFLFKDKSEYTTKNLEILKKIICQCSKCNIEIIELPFVDASSIRSIRNQEQLVQNFEVIKKIAKEHNIILGLETDLDSESFVRFLEKFDSPNIRANYDVGNSISKNFDPLVELNVLKDWIVNVHIKDRYVGGETVPLGSGDVNFKEFFQKLNDIEYKGDLIIQGAREDLTTDIPTKETCSKYLEFINRYLEKRI